MRTVGQILKNERVRQHLTLVDIYKSTKIPICSLKKIEDDRFRELPPATFTKGFLRNYALSLGLDPARVAAVFRRDYIETKKGGILPKELPDEVNRPNKLGFNPRTLSLAGVVGVVVALAAFFLFQLRTFFIPPKITMDELPAQTTQAEIEIKGKVNRDAVVTVNNELVLMVDNEFLYKAKLRAGVNIIEIKAVDRRGQTGAVLKEITLDSEVEK